MASRPNALAISDPALAEFSGRANDHAIAGRKQFATEASIAPVPEDTSASTSFDVPITSFRSARTARVDFAEVLGAVMNVRSHHRVQRLGKQRRGARCQ